MMYNAPEKPPVAVSVFSRKQDDKSILFKSVDDSERVTVDISSFNATAFKWIDI